jgi:hypothetical protein
MEAVDRPWMEEPQGYGGDDDHRYHTVNMYRVRRLLGVRYLVQQYMIDCVCTPTFTYLACVCGIYGTTSTQKHSLISRYRCAMKYESDDRIYCFCAPPIAHCRAATQHERPVVWLWGGALPGRHAGRLGLLRVVCATIFSSVSSLSPHASDERRCFMLGGPTTPAELAM